ncbi:uncharacterized protein [Diadema setosum]|uniref:uncharacterized protein n=1 Tax=Diadema setosum TaxID=31175 RepID=UPI003B3B9197
MASKLLVLAFLVVLSTSSFAMYAFDDGEGDLDEEFGLEPASNSGFEAFMELKRDSTRAKANKKYKICHPVPGSTQECWCYRRSGKMFQCFGVSNGK